MRMVNTSEQLSFIPFYALVNTYESALNNTDFITSSCRSESSYFLRPRVKPLGRELMYPLFLRVAARYLFLILDLYLFVSIVYGCGLWEENA